MRYGLILGDQLSEEIATLKRLDKHEDVILMVELVEEATYVKHHPQKIALIFSAMRHFAKHLKQQGWTVRYQVFDRSKTTNNFLQFLKSQLDKQEAKGLVITECGEYRLQYQMENSWEKELNIPIQILIDDRFFSSIQAFKQWSSTAKILRMEFFYRKLRQQTGYLMQADKPIGGKWNFDSDNRQKWNGTPTISPALYFTHDQIDLDVIALVKAEFQDHIGQIDRGCK